MGPLLPEVPATFGARMRSLHGAPADPWLSELPALMRRLAAHWALLTDGPPFGVSYNLCVPVLARGRRAVLKLSYPGKDFWAEARALDAYRPTGAAAELIDVDDAGAMLIDRVLPGDTLDDEDVEASARVAADLMLRLHTAEVPMDTEPYAALFGRARETALRQRDRPDFPWEWWERNWPAPGEIEGNGPLVLLHEDLHHGNILRSAERGWLSIDPHGVSGPPVHDCVQFLFNPHASMVRNPALALVSRPDGVAVTRRRVAVFASALGLDRDLIIRAALAKVALNYSWDLADGSSWERLGPLARMLEQAAG